MTAVAILGSRYLSALPGTFWPSRIRPSAPPFNGGYFVVNYARELRFGTIKMNLITTLAASTPYDETRFAFLTSSCVVISRRSTISSTMLLKSYCFKCEKIVTAHLWSMTDEQFWTAIKTDAEIKVGHASEFDGNHCWPLKRHERENLRKREHILRQEEDEFET
jgi:hypothetical protein